MTQSVRIQLTKKQANQLEPLRETLKLERGKTGKLGMCIAQPDLALDVFYFGLLPHLKAAQLLKMFFPKVYARQVALGLIEKENEY